MSEADMVMLDSERPLAIVDVDEVLGLFLQGLNGFLRLQGHELRLTTFGLVSNIYRLAAATPVDDTTALALVEKFFATGTGDIEPAPGAIEGLKRLARIAQVVIVSNAPETARALRLGWLKRHDIDYPMILNRGYKGPVVAELSGRVGKPKIFVDDLLMNLDSVAEHAPDVITFQMIADPVLRRIAPSNPAKHPRLDDWPAFTEAASAVLRGAAPC